MSMSSEETKLLDPSADPQVKLYAFRWVILAMYFLLEAANAAVYITFGPIVVETSTCFNQSLLAVNAMAGMSAISAIALLFPSIWWMKRIGIRKAMFISASCQAICGGLRIVAPLVPGISLDVYFWLIFVSQLFGALPNALLAALPAEISSHWFGEKERSIATSIGALGQLIGIAAGQAFSGYYIGGKADACHNFMWMLVSQGIASVAVSLPPMIFFAEHPPSPPSYARNVESHCKPMTLWQEIKHCLAIRALRVLMAIFAIGMGTFITLWAVMQQILVSVQLSTNISVIMVGCGVVGAGIAGLVIDKYRNYRTVIFIYGPGGVVGLVLFFLGCWLPNLVLDYVGAALAGFCLIALTPVVFEAAAEITFPVDEVTSTALLLILGNLHSIIFLVVFSVVDESQALLVLLIMLCIYAASYVLIIWFNPTYKRLEMETLRDARPVN